ncbi:MULTISPECIES: hypothetical protein [unclassified Colwellia]|uniref:hypothetical protein n=2 Tax=Colwellia TaxID=28228 RepID=UPI0015F6382D|nr:MULTISPECIES: hypothetical protein [unclassified Colwellia]MBA6232872.1 hypothetical protein [Colwellia sp. MB02u-7]MBA6237006.1 hypothetical protein [Colwellia sp. MB02u-11]MBA6258208.1 hypothetical protein [Colwellia sp. MB3u-28]MBA6259635.1 hypothetical protein [Colwellia sp. MB3u-41]MBA6299515.1 hypothetical protein [Colwellia sp. MB3u-22]
MKNGFTGVFAIASVLKTLVLCVLTLGSYLMYKLYQFSVQINRHTELKISKTFIFITLFLYTLSLGSLLHALANWQEPGILNVIIGFHVISSIFDVTWIIMVRKRINLIAGATKGDKLWLNPFITSIFHVIYMQHKINQGLAKMHITNNSNTH